VFVSVASRFVANIEALNAVESVGNVTKHRRAPVVVFDKRANSYTIRYVPAISGESLGHAYQANVLEFAKNVYGDKVPVCKWCGRGEFLKEVSEDYMVDEVKALLQKVASEVKKLKEEDLEEIKHEFEKVVIRNCLIEDIGGFLSAGRIPVKRTSAFQTSYVVPVLDAIEATVIDTQFHTRHAPVIAAKVEVGGGREGQEEKSEEKKSKSSQAPEVAAQMIYYVEVASAVYGLYMNVDLDAIGRTRLVRVEDAVDGEERKRRVMAALGGLALTVLGNFGAKRSRFNPISEVKSVLLSIARPQSFSVTPPHYSNYIRSTAERASSFAKMMEGIGAKFEVKLLAYDVEGHEKVPSVEYFDNVESLFKAAIDYVSRAL
jgi:CRISPR-associated protein Csa2